MAVFCAEIQDVGELHFLRCEVMDSVGVVPEDAKVWSSGLHGGEARGDSIGINGTGWVTVFGHAPNPFDRRLGGD